MYPIGLMDNQLTKVDQDGVPLLVQNILLRNDYAYEAILFDGSSFIVGKDSIYSSCSPYYPERMEDDFASITKLAEKRFKE